VLGHLFFRNPRLLLLALALIVVAGLAAYELLPRREDPELTARFAIVTTPYPGATADRVEALVTEKLEEALRERDEIQLLQSSSRPGISIIQIELRDAIDDVAPVWSRLRDEIERVELPQGVGRPDLDDRNVDAFAMIVGFRWRGAGEVPLNIMQRLAEQLEDRMRSLPGTKETRIFGASPEEIRVEVDPARLASLGLTPSSVADAVKATDSKVSAGQLRHAESNLLIEVEGELDSLARLRRTPIRYGEDGTVIRLGEIATIERGRADPPEEIALLDGEPGISVGVFMQRGQRIDRWAGAARAELEAFRARLPGGVELELLFDQSVYTERRFGNLLGNLMLGALFVFVVVLFVMGWRSALLVGIALPLSALMVLAGMRAIRLPIEQMSVTGLIIALGLLIDNAIVMVDEVRHRLQHGDDAGDAVLGAGRKLAIPLFGSTLTTVLSFMPLVLMPGPAGEFVGGIGMSVILAIVSSFLLALTVVPAMTGLMGKCWKRSPEGGLWRDGFRSKRLANWYGEMLGGLLRRPVVAILFALALPVFGFAVAGQLEEQFFPPTDRDEFAIAMRLPPQSSIRETEAVAKQARELILRHDEVKRVHWFAGSSAPKFFYNMTEGEDGTPSFAQAYVQLDGMPASPEFLNQLQDELDRELPEAQFLVRQLEQGPPFEAPVELRLYGPDPEVLFELGEKLRAELSRIEGVTHTRSTLADGNPKLAFATDEIEVNRAGFDHRQLAARLEASLEGALGGSIIEETEELPVRVRVKERGDLDRIASLELLGNDGRSWVPLRALGEMKVVPELADLPRRNGERVNTVQGFLRAGLLPSVVVAELQSRVGELKLPAGYHADLGGEAAERDEAVGNLMASVGLLLVLMIATLVLSFQSFRTAALIGIVATLCIGLALAAIWIFGYPFGFMAIVGTMGLVGVAINDSIVVLAALRDNEAARRGDSDAVRDVVVRSTRHVVATTLTTIAGFIPLLVDGGAFWPPLAVSIAGGVAGATVLALYFVPAAWILMRREPRTEVQGVALSPAPATA
jgi:multidrug efflux pump subunit AcrB